MSVIDSLNFRSILLYLFLFTERTNSLSILPKRRAPISIAEELGTSPTFGNNFFDPLQLANEDNFAIFREAELKHGRIAMMAVIGNTLPELWKPPLPLYLSPSNEVTFQEVPCGLKALTVVPFMGWVQIVAFIGFLETKVFIQNDRKDMPGDYGTGYFGVRNKGANERALIVELENGRLAMLAFVWQVVSEIVTGQNAIDPIRYMLPWNEVNAVTFT